MVARFAKYGVGNKYAMDCGFAFDDLTFLACIYTGNTFVWRKAFLCLRDLIMNIMRRKWWTFFCEEDEPDVLPLSDVSWPRTLLQSGFEGEMNDL
jgi:hypothetical protein